MCGVLSPSLPPTPSRLWLSSTCLHQCFFQLPSRLWALLSSLISAFPTEWGHTLTPSGPWPHIPSVSSRHPAEVRRQVAWVPGLSWPRQVWQGQSWLKRLLRGARKSVCSNSDAMQASHPVLLGETQTPIFVETLTSPGNHRGPGSPRHTSEICQAGVSKELMLQENRSWCNLPNLAFAWLSRETGSL